MSYRVWLVLPRRGLSLWPPIMQVLAFTGASLLRSVSRVPCRCFSARLPSAFTCASPLRRRVLGASPLPRSVVGGLPPASGCRAVVSCCSVYPAAAFARLRLRRRCAPALSVVAPPRPCFVACVPRSALLRFWLPVGRVTFSY